MAGLLLTYASLREHGANAAAILNFLLAVFLLVAFTWMKANLLRTYTLAGFTFLSRLVDSNEDPASTPQSVLARHIPAYI